jgi:hypothetical protein
MTISINTIIILAIYVIFYAYVGYGLLVWAIVTYKKFKKYLWSFLK